MDERILYEENAVLRHSATERLEHWLIAISGFVLIFSGFGELPMYKRYMVTSIPGLGWAGNFFINLHIHYIAAVVFFSVTVFHIVYHGRLGHRGLLPQKGDIRKSARTVLSMFGFGEEPPADKYLPEQRLAYVYLGGVGLILVVTGIVKVAKNLPTVFLPPGLVTAATLIHTFATIFFLLGVIAHVAALVFKVNRPLVMPMFTGKVNQDYVRHRHPLWYERLSAVSPGPGATAAGEKPVDQHDAAAPDSAVTTEEAGDDRRAEAERTETPAAEEKELEK